MIKLLSLLVFVLYAAQGLSKNETDEKISLKFVQSVVIDTKAKFEGTKLGGFSGLVIKGGDFFVVTDDRGRHGEPRLYRLAVTIKSQKNGEPDFEIVVKEKISLFNKTKKIKIYDFEALVPFRDGWIVSTEGDWSIKPKELPAVLYVQNKKVKKEIEIPKEFQPVFKGKQTGGLYNNKAFEGLFIDPISSQLFLLSESGLSQKSDGDSIFYLLEYKTEGEKFKHTSTSRLDFSKHLDGGNVYSGATDLFKLGENRFLILTRSVQTSLSLQYANVVWLVGRNSTSDPWEIKSKFQVSGTMDPNAIEKGLPVTDELNQNYEGMSVLEFNGKNYLVLVSDDNFNSFEKTVFSFFELEVK